MLKEEDNQKHQTMFITFQYFTFSKHKTFNASLTNGNRTLQRFVANAMDWFPFGSQQEAPNTKYNQDKDQIPSSRCPILSRQIPINTKSYTATGNLLTKYHLNKNLILSRQITWYKIQALK